MCNFRTEIKLKPHSGKIEYDTSVMFLGSCFSTNIGDQFTKARLKTLVNPYGVIYNPYSVANTLRSLIEERLFTVDDIHFYGEQWHSFFHHSTFSNSNKEKCLQDINEERKISSDFLRETKYLFLTFGTAWVYESKSLGYVVSNCHKYPAGEFNRYILSVEDIVKEYEKLLEELLIYNPDVQIIFTVSPVRHWKDGAHGNQLSKSVLLLAVNSLVEKYSFCKYFPAYELLMDDLRDYRFYADDMLHPNNLAIEYIWDKFKFCFFSSKTLEYIRELTKLNKAIQHKPFDFTSDSYQNFLKKQIETVGNLKNKYPKTDLKADLRFLEEKLRSSLFS